MENFFIKDGYCINKPEVAAASPYCDNEESSRKYQYEVYNLARKVIIKNKLNSVLDIGCGYGIKLKELIYPICSNITGVDTEHSINFCNKTYNFGEWYVDDIEHPKLKNGNKYDIIICSDVIEHLVNPDNLIEYIGCYSHKDTYIVLLTTERDLTRGKNNLGPPQNRAHIREWNKLEFSSYLSDRGLSILKHYLTINYPNSWRTKIKSFFFPWSNESQMVLVKFG